MTCSRDPQILIDDCRAARNVGERPSRMTSQTRRFLPRQIPAAPIISIAIPAIPPPIISH